MMMKKWKSPSLERVVWGKFPNITLVQRLINLLYDSQDDDDHDDDYDHHHHHNHNHDNDYDHGHDHDFAQSLINPLYDSYYDDHAEESEKDVDNDKRVAKTNNAV